MLLSSKTVIWFVRKKYLRFLAIPDCKYHRQNFLRVGIDYFVLMFHRNCVCILYVLVGYWSKIVRFFIVYLAPPFPVDILSQNLEWKQLEERSYQVVKSWMHVQRFCDAA